MTFVSALKKVAQDNKHSYVILTHCIERCQLAPAGPRLLTAPNSGSRGAAPSVPWRGHGAVTAALTAAPDRPESDALTCDNRLFRLTSSACSDVICGEPGLAVLIVYMHYTPMWRGGMCLSWAHTTCNHINY